MLQHSIFYDIISMYYSILYYIVRSIEEQGLKRGPMHPGGFDRNQAGVGRRPGSYRSIVPTAYYTMVYYSIP